MDNLSFLLENGMPLGEITRLQETGISLDEIAATARNMVNSGRSLVMPQETVKEALPEFFDEKGRFLHNVLGEYLIEMFGCCKINGAVHVYDSGVYRPGEEALHGIMVDLLPSLSDAKRRETFKYIKVCRRTPVKELSPPNLIPFRNQVYDLKTGEFLDYSKDLVFLNKFPWNYEPEAPECPTVTDTLNAIANGDNEVVKLLLESFGNCFHLLNSYRGAVALYGPSGSNGKSTLLNMLRQLVGTENASFLSLQDTAERFRLMEIYGRAVNIGDDISGAYLPDSSLFKKLVTGETVLGEKKGQDPVSFRPYAKFFFALNELPPVSDKSSAFFSRLLLVPMQADFSSTVTRDVSLKDKQWSPEEMTYLTRLAMDGLKRLIAQGDFTRPCCVQRAMLEYEIENNPTLGFIAEYVDLVGKPTEMVYADFRRWCEDNGHRNITTRKRFTKEVCRLAGLRNVSTRHPYFCGKTGQCYAEA